MPRILVVEDEPALRMLLLRYLSRSGFESEGVGSAEEAGQVLGAVRSFDSYVVDLTLPGQSGLDLAARILALQPDARILLTSGDPYEPNQAGSRNPRLAFLRKPFQPKDLAEALQRLSESG